MKRVLILIAVITCTCNAYSQGYIPDTAWTRCYGGTAFEKGYYIQQTFDGGYVLIGTATSVDGDLANSSPGNKNWILKLDSLGNIEWQRDFPWNGPVPLNIKQTSDSGYIHGGQVFTKRDASGNVVWQDSIHSRVVLQTHDGGYALGNYEYLTKLSTSNTVEWASPYYMSDLISLEQAPDSGYVTGHFTPGDQSPDMHEGRLLDKNGDYLYGAMFSITCTSCKLSAKPTLDNAIIGAGHGSGFGDSWGYIHKRDSDLHWNRTLQDTFPADIIQLVDSNYIFCGFDAPGDAIISKITPVGNDIISRSMGGSSDDELVMMMMTRDSGYILIGTTESNDGDVWGNHGQSDIWVVKLKQDTSIHVPPPVLSVNEVTLEGVKIYPNPTTGNINVSLPKGFEHADLLVFTIVGQSVEYKLTGKGNMRQIDLSGQPSGQYIVVVSRNNIKKSYRITLVSGE